MMPDVDINVADNIRSKVIEWLKDLYKGRFCQISNFSSLSGKIVVKDVYKVIDEATEDEAQFASNLIDRHQGIVEDIKTLPETNEQFGKWVDSHEETFNIALQLKDIVRQTSIHASGYFISNEELLEITPIVLGKNGELISCFEMNDAAKIGVKLDLLGLTTNGYINEIFKLIPEKRDEINIQDDPLIYNVLKEPYARVGLYQISAYCAYHSTLAVKPNNLDELSDINALARPGALQFLNSYVNNNAENPHPIFEEILKPTRGFCLYQEQLMQMAVAMGFEATDGELLRKCISKKDLKKVKEWKQKIYDKCKENDLGKEVADLFWGILEASAKYSFNASHSYSTAALGALTVYLKYKYPLEFFVCYLNFCHNFQNPIEEISKAIAELSEFNIKMLPPHLLKSENKFSIEGDNIRYGLSFIKGIADAAIEKLCNFKNKYSNKFEVFEGAKEAGIGLNVLCPLIQAGALEIENQSRTLTVFEAQFWGLLTNRERPLVMALGKKFNYSPTDIIKHLNQTKNEKGTIYIKDSRVDTIRSKMESFGEIYQQNKKNEKFANWYYESYLLGFSYSSDLKTPFLSKDRNLLSLREVGSETEENAKQKVVFPCLVKSCKARTSMKKNKYLIIVISDGDLLKEVKLFNYKKNDEVVDNIADLKEDNFGKLPKENDIAIVTGIRKGEDIWAERIVIQHKIKIFTKLSELKTYNKAKNKVKEVLTNKT